jgi:sarcosine oxidase subunit beta
MNPDVLIIGGGLMGLSTALYLSLRGQRCMVIERHSPGRHASGVNAGGLRRLNRHPAEIPLSLAAAEIWSDIRSLVDSDCDVRLSAQVRVAESGSDMAKLEARAELVRSLGYDHEVIVDREELYRLVPALAEHCVGALACYGDGFARPFHAATAFRQKAEALGTRFLVGEEVTALEQVSERWRVVTPNRTLEAPTVVNTAGAWAGRIAEKLGDRVPVTTGAPMMMVTARVPRFLDAVVGAASRKLSFKQMQNGTVVIGGAHLARHEMTTETTEIDFAKLKVSAESVTALFPTMEKVPIVRTWAGLEAFTHDGLPVIGPDRQHSGIFHAFGFSAHGFQLSPVVGRILSELILEGRSSLPIEPFAIGRFTELKSGTI